MAIVYLEELVKQVPNKYLAVNVIAKRARALNDELLGAGLSKKQKPVSVATEELASGELTYKRVDPNTLESEMKAILTSESEDSNAVDKDKQIPELFGESSAEDSDADTENTVETEDSDADRNNEDEG